MIVFSRGSVRKLHLFTVGNDKLDIVSSFQYLGIKLNYNNSFKVAQRDLYDRATMAMFALLIKCSRLILPIDVIFDLFDRTIVPMLTYGCEV